jgi:peptide/nickel transport system permease protein
MDDIIRESVKFNVIDSLNNQKIKFNDLAERQNYIDNQINLQVKNLGLDQPWYSPNRFFNTLFKVMFLDLGKSNYCKDQVLPAKDIIMKNSKTLLFIYYNYYHVAVIEVYPGTYLAIGKIRPIK